MNTKSPPKVSIRTSSPAKPAVTYKTTLRTYSPSKTHQPITATATKFPTKSPSKTHLTYSASPLKSTNNYHQQKTSSPPKKQTPQKQQQQPEYAQNNFMKTTGGSPVRRISSASPNKNSLSYNNNNNINSINATKTSGVSTQLNVVQRIINTADLDKLLEKLKNNRDSLCQNIQIYYVLVENNAPMRCLLHNNFTTLYCENQQKQLCVNCVYNNVQHKLHRVVPIKNSLKQIVEDNSKFEAKVKKITDGIEEFEKGAIKAVFALKQGLTKTLDTIATEFEKIQHRMLVRYQQIKSQAISEYEGAKLKFELIIQQASLLKIFYKQKGKKNTNIENQNMNIYTHMIFNTLMDAEKYDSRSLPPNPVEDYVSRFTSEFVRLREQAQKILVTQKTG